MQTTCATALDGTEIKRTRREPTPVTVWSARDAPELDSCLVRLSSHINHRRTKCHRGNFTRRVFHEGPWRVITANLVFVLRKPL